MKDGMLLNLVFSNDVLWRFDVEQCVNHQNDRVWGRNASVEGKRLSRHQNPTSVMARAAVTATGRSPLVFVPSGVKLNSQRYISDILEGELLPWAREHFEEESRTFKQDSCALTWFKNDPTVDSGPHSGVYQQGRLALKEPGPESFGLFGVVHPREQGLPNFSWFSQESDCQIAAGVGLDPPRSSVCLVQAFQGKLKQIIKNKGGRSE